MKDLGNEHFESIVESTDVQNVDGQEYNFTKHFNYNHYCEYSSIPGYTPPQASSGVKGPRSGLSTTGTARNPRSSGSTVSVSKKLKMTCPKQLQISPKKITLLNGVKKRTPKLNFNSLFQSKAGSKYNYYCKYSDAGISLLQYSSSRKCEIRNTRKLYCP